MYCDVARMAGGICARRDLRHAGLRRDFSAPPGKVVIYVHGTWESRKSRPRHLGKSQIPSMATDKVGIYVQCHLGKSSLTSMAPGKVVNHVHIYLGKSQIPSIIQSEIMQSHNLEPEKRGFWMRLATLHDKRSNYRHKQGKIEGFNHNVYAKTCIMPLLRQKHLGKSQISSKKC